MDRTTALRESLFLFSERRDRLLLRTSTNYRPAFQLKDETQLNGWKWTSWNELRCHRFENTGLGKWIWKWWYHQNGWQGQLSGDGIIEFGDSAMVPNSLFPESKDIAVATCREYATCEYFWMNKVATKDPLIAATCENVNGSEDNCDRLKFHCPKGLKPNVEYVTCERIPTTIKNVYSKWNGEWKFPEIGQTHEDITCQKDNDFTDENSVTTPESTREPTSEPTSETTSEQEIKL